MDKYTDNKNKNVNIMEIQKDTQGKWIKADYNKYLTQTSAIEDIDKVLVNYVFIPLTESNDEWIEISAEDAERIRKAKDAAKGSIDYPEEEVNQALSLFTMTINSLELTDDQALSVKNLYPKWESFINQSLKKDMKVNYNDKLFKVKSDIDKVLENQPPSIDTAALYEEINESHAGAKEDPIPYDGNMKLFVGKYYSQNDIVYKCIRNSDVPLYHDLSTLIGNYVEIAL